MNRPQAVPHHQFENERLCVTEWRFAPGATTGFHRHERDYCVVPLTTGTLTIETPSGTETASLVTGQSYFRRAGVEHEVINTNDFPFAFVDIELKE
jgi:quercetin dioxygenase-like cupin family protein